MAARRFSNGGEITFTPHDIAQVFEEADIDKTWTYLEVTFHISRVWRADFKKKFAQSSRNISAQEFFVQYCLQRIDEPLKILTQRKESVIFSVLRYLLKSRLEEKRRDASHQRNYYK